jgi:hypothetical protein
LLAHPPAHGGQVFGSVGQLFVGMSAAGEQPSWHLLLPFTECADCLPISEALQQFIAAAA